MVFANHYSMIHGSLYYSKLLVTQNDFHYFISFDLQLWVHKVWPKAASSITLERAQADQSWGAHSISRHGPY